MLRRLKADWATARRRIACLRHVATFLTLELIVGLVALLWGAVVLAPTSSFASLRYAAFDIQNETTWGAYFVVLGAAALFVALTRSRSTRFILDVMVCFSFAQLVWRLAHSPEPIVPATFVYALVGVVLPLVSAGWHFLLLVIDDIANVSCEVRQAWLDE
ncbi:MAG: hypothetical protein LCH53_04410 [Bacteroidetes bacterium]|nr:hypothetical protein [Bacteroidota bacterium]